MQTRISSGTVKYAEEYGQRACVCSRLGYETWIFSRFFFVNLDVFCIIHIYIISSCSQDVQLTKYFYNEIYFKTIHTYVITFKCKINNWPIVLNLALHKKKYHFRVLSLWFLRYFWRVQCIVSVLCFVLYDCRMSEFASLHQRAWWHPDKMCYYCIFSHGCVIHIDKTIPFFKSSDLK